VSSPFGLFFKGDGVPVSLTTTIIPEPDAESAPLPRSLDDLRHLKPRDAQGDTAALWSTREHSAWRREPSPTLPGKVAEVPVILQTLTDAKKEVAAMLLFTRREGQSLVLETSDGPIELKLAYLNGEHARIGIDAPSSVGIVRKEASHQQNQKETPVELDLDNELWWRHPEDMTA